MKVFLVIVVVTLLATASGYAQASDDGAVNCNRAWLASDWPTVASECLRLAEIQESDSQRYHDDANAPTQGPDGGQFAQQLSFETLFIAGEARARTAVGYAKLKKKNLYATELQKAIEELNSVAANTADTKVAARAAMLNGLVTSPHFVHDAPDSDLLAHI